MRFEFLALLAYKRINETSDQAWIHLSEVAQLPSWAGNSKRNIETNLGRYLQQFEKTNLELVSAPRRWSGPYRLGVDTVSIDFDVSIPEVKKLLRIPATQPAMARRELYKFTVSYTKAQVLLFQGKLKSSKKGDETNALSVLLALTRNERLSATLHTMALLGVVQVQFRAGRFLAARKTLLNYADSLSHLPDKALKSAFYQALAWSYQRATSGATSNRKVETAISSASALAEASADRAALGLVAHRTAGYLTKKGLHIEAINHLLRSLELHLAIGNYEMVQATCGNIGSVVHRLGPAYYKEARRWIILGIEISRWMGVGRNDAHGEMILAKMYIESGNKSRSYWLLRRAERVATSSENKVNLGDVKMGWGFWHQRFGTTSKMRDALIDAAHTFRGMRVFDRRQKQEYMERRFPEVWPAVLSRL